MGSLRTLVKGVLVRRHHARNQALRRTLAQDGGSMPPGLWDLEVNAAGHLSVEGHDLVDLATRFGTPLHVVNRRRLQKDFDGFVEAFRSRWPRVEVAYSYKTNPLPGVIRELHAMGAWAEVISHFELWLALELGVDPDRIVYNGPAKSDDGLRLAVTRGVRLVNVDNLDEIERLDRIAGSVGRRQAAGVRLVSSVGWSGQFGHAIANGEAAAAFERLAASAHLDACGLHIHLGTGLLDVDKYLRAIREALAFARQAERKHGIALRFLDFGGGFGVPTVRPIGPWDTRLMALGYPPGPVDPGAVPRIDAFADAIVGVVREFYSPDPHAPTLIFEPGRAITSSAQMLLLGVLAVKPTPQGTRRVILDGGRNIAIPTGYELHELFPASRMRDRADTINQFYGPLCHPGDVLLRGKRFPAVNAGDVVALMDTGAYFVPNQMNFSNPRPAAIMVGAGRCELIRDREAFDDIVKLDRSMRQSMAPSRPVVAQPSTVAAGAQDRHDG